MKATEKQSDFPPSDNSEQVIKIALSIRFPHILSTLQSISSASSKTQAVQRFLGENERIISTPSENKTY